MTTRSIAVVSAGLSQPSTTRLLADRLATATTSALADAGHDVVIETVELRDHAQAITNHLLTGFPGAGLRAVLDAIGGADGLIVVSPIFSASYSGLFKSFFDVLEPDCLTGKPVLIAATGGTARHSLALEFALRPLFAHLRATVAPTAVFAATEDWASSGESQALSGRVSRAASELAGLVLGSPRVSPVDPFEEVTPFARLLAGEG